MKMDKDVREYLRELAFGLDNDLSRIGGDIQIIKDVEGQLNYIRDEVDKISLKLESETEKANIIKLFTDFKELHRPLRMMNELLFFTVQELEKSFKLARIKKDDLFEVVVRGNRELIDKGKRFSE